MDELTLDKAFKAKLDEDSVFQNWLIRRTKFAGRRLALITDKIWHQRWWRDPETKKDSETDIFVVFRDEDTDQRLALHIENKVAKSVWMPYQAENYAKRASARMKSYNYVDFQTVLMAPDDFLKAWTHQVNQFDIVLKHEDIARFVPEFGVSTP